MAWLACAGSLLTTEPVNAQTDAVPVSVQEICLLLRGGDSGVEVLRETAGRPLLTPLDDGAETLLRDAGADPSFIVQLRATHPPATAAQAAAERERQAQLARQREESWEASQARLMEASRAAMEATIATRSQEAQQTLARLLRGKLIVYRDQRIQTYNDDGLPQKKEFAFYFAKLADMASRKFTTQLVEFYKKYAPAHPEFELVFISKDYSGTEMETDLRYFPMPWPALDYARLAEEKEFTAPGNGEIPRLLVVNGAGRLIVDSYTDGRYVGPEHVLEELQRRAEASAEHH